MCTSKRNSGSIIVWEWPASQNNLESLALLIRMVFMNGMVVSCIGIYNHNLAWPIMRRVCFCYNVACYCSPVASYSRQ